MATKQEVNQILEGIDFTMKYRHTDAGWWIAYCEEVPAARTQGETKEEVKENLRDAISFILEDSSTEELEELREELAAEESELLAL